MAAFRSSHDPVVLKDGENSRGRRAPPDLKVRWMYLFLAGAKVLARWDEGDCQTPVATKSLVSAAPDP